MGATPADTQHEIVRLRDDATRALLELQSRFRGGTKAVAGGEVRAHRVRVQRDVHERVEPVAAQVRQHTTAIGAAGAVAFGALGWAAYSAVERWREQRRPDRQLARRARATREQVEDRVQDLLQTLEKTRERGVLLKVEREKGGYLRVTDARLDPPQSLEGKKTDVLKNLLWAAILALSMAFAGVLARRAAGALWRATIHEEPPTSK